MTNIKGFFQKIDINHGQIHGLRSKGFFGINPLLAYPATEPVGVSHC